MIILNKYHALKNDYLVLYEHNISNPESFAKYICDRRLGVGSDGVLIGACNELLEKTFNLRIFNPDGSEAEKSGNGIRIYCKYLFDNKLVKLNEKFFIKIKDELVESLINDMHSIKLKIGEVTFLKSDCSIYKEEKLVPEIVKFKGCDVKFYRVSVGNPHCVLFDNKFPISEIGPYLEENDLFKDRTNVQIVNVIDEYNIKIEIWERGAGMTESSGTSSVATAALCHRLGKSNDNITVHMNGGKVLVELDKNFNAVLIGDAHHIAEIRVGELK